MAEQLTLLSGRKAIRYTSIIPIAGDQITNDIVMALRTPTREAEDIKRRYGCALSELADAAERWRWQVSMTDPAGN